MSHTPGPWNIHPAYIGDQPIPVRSEDGEQRWNWLALRIAKGERLIGYAEFNDCDDCGFPRIDDLEEARANARLMVAAPELLSALEAVMLTVAGCERDAHWVASRAAIAKAKGGA
jgi:hypothetical protein